MSRQIPKYRRHANGQAFVQHKSIPNPGNRLYLGTYGSAVSKQKYQRFLARLNTSSASPTPIKVGDEPMVVELIAAYDEFAARYYSKDGKPSKEYRCMCEALAPLDRLFGDMVAAEFGPRHLVQLQDHLINRGYSRLVINNRIGRVKRFWRWCCREGHVPADLYHGLQAVSGLRRGRSNARESKPVPPVAWHWVEQTLPFLSPTVRAMVRTQFLCGMRPEEVCSMRAIDIDMTGEIWLYRPEQHKNDWRGHGLTKAIPKVAQDIIRPFLARPVDAYLFSPAESHAWHREQRVEQYRQTRKGKVYPYEVRKREKERKSRQRKPSEHHRDHYTTAAYGRSITYAIRKAATSEIEIPHWSPNQLRHAISTLISQQLGQQAAQRWLGHARLETTSIYTEVQASELIQIAQALDERWAG